MIRKTVTIKAENTFTGIVKKGESYSKQTYSNTSQVLIGKEGTSVGRGYFSYDLSKIPKKSKIANVTLKMTSWYNVDNSKYGADFVIAPSFQNITSEYEWDFLKIPGYPRQTLKVNIGHTLFYTVPVKHWLETGIQGNFGGKFNLMVNHLYEGTKFLKIGGSTDAIEMIITYDIDEEEPVNPPVNPPVFPYKRPLFQVEWIDIAPKENLLTLHFYTDSSVKSVNVINTNNLQNTNKILKLKEVYKRGNGGRVVFEILNLTDKYGGDVPIHLRFYWTAVEDGSSQYSETAYLVPRGKENYFSSTKDYVNKTISYKISDDIYKKYEDDLYWDGRSLPLPTCRIKGGQTCVYKVPSLFPNSDMNIELGGDMAKKEPSFANVIRPMVMIRDWGW